MATKFVAMHIPQSVANSSSPIKILSVQSNLDTSSDWNDNQDCELDGGLGSANDREEEIYDSSEYISQVGAKGDETRSNLGGKPTQVRKNVYSEASSSDSDDSLVNDDVLDRAILLRQSAKKTEVPKDPSAALNSSSAHRFNAKPRSNDKISTANTRLDVSAGNLQDTLSPETARSVGDLKRMRQSQSSVKSRLDFREHSDSPRSSGFNSKPRSNDKISTANTRLDVSAGNQQDTLSPETTRSVGDLKRMRPIQSSVKSRLDFHEHSDSPRSSRSRPFHLESLNRPESEGLHGRKRSLTGSDLGSLVDAKATPSKATGATSERSSTQSSTKPVLKATASTQSKLPQSALAENKVVPSSRLSGQERAELDSEKKRNEAIMRRVVKEYSELNAKSGREAPMNANLLRKLFSGVGRKETALTDNQLMSMYAHFKS